MFYIIGTLKSGEKAFMAPAKTITYFEAEKPIGKQALEEMQLMKFKTIAEKKFPEYTFESYELCKPDPPDYIIKRKDIDVRLELTAFGEDYRKRNADKLFKFKQTFKAEYKKGKLQNIRGFKFILTLKNDVLKSKPRTEKAIDNVITFLNKLVIPSNFEALLFSHPLNTPGPLPHPHGATYSDDDIDMLITEYSQSPDNEYMAECGFDFDIDDQNNYVLEDSIADLNKIISDKDDPRNDELLIISGGPNQKGIASLEEANALRFFLEDAQSKLNSPKYLKSIYILDWPQERIYKLEIPRHA